MPFREFHYRWEYDLESSPEQLWPLVADTNRFNRDAGVPAVEPVISESKGLKNARRRLRLSTFGIPIEWEEQPFEWVRPRRFGVVRRYSKGPVAELRVLAELTPREEIRHDRARALAALRLHVSSQRVSRRSSDMAATAGRDPLSPCCSRCGIDGRPSSGGGEDSLSVA